MASTQHTPPVSPPAALPPEWTASAAPPTAGYREGDCLVRTPTGGIHAPRADEFVRGSLADGSLATAAQVRLGSRRRPTAWLAGALPFDPQAEAVLGVYPHAGLRAPSFGLRASDQAGHGPAGVQAEASRRPQLVQVRSSSAVPDRDGYLAAVQHAVEAIQRGELDKVVLGRLLALRCQNAVDVGHVVSRLHAVPHAAMRFAVPCADGKGGLRTLVGATPELLVSLSGGRFVAHPMAGSIPRTGDRAEDAARSHDLLTSSKDRREHALVVDAVRAALQPLARALHVPPVPTVIETPTVLHLSTRIEGELRDPSRTVLDLVSALHPTPAVCGTPTRAAHATLRALEGFDRALFAGAVGYCDPEGNGAFGVSIRCAELDGRSVRLFAGAGIVGDSDPALEYAETGAKLRTMLQVLGLDGR